MPKTTNNAAKALALVAHAAAIFIFTSVASASVATSPVITAVYTTYSATGVPTNLNITGTGLCSTATCTTKPVVKLAGVAQTVTGGTSTGVGVKLGVIADGDYVLNITVGSYSANYNLTIKSSGTGSGGTATVSVGTTTTGAVGTSASVTNSGTTTAAILNFTIPRGDQGPAGTPGTQGPMGLPGVQGPQGVPGPTGQTGQTGASGPMGLQGPAGADGAQGPVGPAGAKGDKGDTGEAGAAGTDGTGLAFKGAWLVGTTYAPLDVVTQDGSSFIAVAGSTGVSPTVDVTDNGGNWAMLAAKGAEGPQGPAGTDGTAGAIGPQGPAGAAGRDGAAGIDGVPGRDGTDGLPGLPGIPGLPGAPGPQGPIGPQGPAGAEGPTGPQGTPGATGVAGAGVNARGAWSASVTYQANDLVSYGGATYIATATTGSGGAGYSQIVNVDWIANATTDANGTSFPSGASTIRLNLPAGTYTATPIGPSQGGAYTSGQFCTCNISQGVPSWWWGFNYRTSANPTPTRVQGVNRFWTAPEALAAATPITITLAADGWVEFLLVDTPIGDNTNGVSLLLTAPGTSAATPDQDSAHWAVFAAAGATGAAGPAGSDGSQGPAGATGATGAQGPAGPIGPTGAAGVGLPGPQGQTGPIGPAGPQGPSGPVGSLPAGTAAGTMLYWTGSEWTEVTPPSSSGITLLFCDGKPVWAATCPVVPPPPPPPVSFLFSEDFTDGSFNTSIFEAPAGAFTLSAEGLYRTNLTDSTTRAYLRTTDAGYLARDFTFEVKFRAPSEPFDIAFVGFGEAVPDAGYYTEPKNSLLFRIHRFGNISRIDVAVHTAGYEAFNYWSAGLGSLPAPASPSEIYTARITKVGNRATFTITGAGTTLTDTITDIAAVAPFLNGTNTRLFLGNGIGTLKFISATLTQ